MPDDTVTAGSGAASGSQGQHFFSTPEIAQKLDLLRHLTDNSERIVVLRGGEGSGKSTLFQRYQESARQEWVVCPLLSNPMLHPEQLFSQLGRCFGVKGEDDQVLELLLERFEMLVDEGRSPVIVVDDAHMLPVSTIIALLRLYERRPSEAALVRIVLFALPQIDDLLRTPQIQTMNLQMLQMLELSPLSREQSRDFISFIGGFSGEVNAAFDEAEVERIVRVSGGVPGEIEALVLGTMRACASGVDVESPDVESTAGEVELSVKPGGIPLPVIMGGGAVAVLLVLALLFQDSINALFEEKPASEVIEIALPEPGGMESIEVVRDLPASRPVDPVPEITPAEVEEVVRPVQEPLDEIGMEVPEAEVVDDVIESVAETESEPETEALVEAAPEAEAISGPVVEVAEVVAKETDVATAPVTSEPEIPALEAAPAKPVVEERAVVAVSGSDRLKGNAWLQVQNPGAYTLQLIGVQSEAAAKAFVSRHKLEPMSAVFKTSLQGKPWYSVVYGVYSDRDAAVVARDKLPAALGSYSAWPRSFASIQQALE